MPVRITPSQRRAGRRARARARLQFHLHKQGLCILDNSGLQRLLETLQSHHSRDPGLLRRIAAAMTSQKKPAWKCADCRRLIKGNDLYCPACGQFWEDCADNAYLDPAASASQRAQTPSRHTSYRSYAQEDAYWDGWYNAKSSSQSPRSRQQKPKSQRRRHGDGKGGGGKGKGKGGKTQTSPHQGMGQEGMAPLPPPPMPPPTGPSDSWMQFAPPYHAVGGPAQETPMNAPSPAEAKLKEVMGILKKNETELPAEVAAVMKDTKVHEGMQKIQGMHEAAEELGNAQQRLEQVCFARAQNLASWRQFLHLSVQRWQEYTQRFQCQEKHNLEQITKARDDVKKAQAIFRELQDRGVITIEAEDDPAMMDDTLMNTESSQEDRRWPHTFDDIVGRICPASRSRTCRSRGATEETTEKGCQCGTSTDRFQTCGNSINAAFWWGSQWMTPEYSCGQPATSPHLIDYIVGWTHSIVSEQDFTSPWEATSRALELSFELCTLPALGCRHNTIGPEDFDTERRYDRTMDSRSLRFCDDVEVFFGIEDCLNMVSDVVRHQDLCQATKKPWGWFFSNDTWTYDHDKDLYKPLKVNRSCQEPLSNTAVSIRQTHQPMLLRITDQWHQPLPEEAQQRTHDQEGQEPDPDIIPEPHGAPNFVHDLFELAERHRVFTDLDHDGSMRIRTWYLYHQDERYCEVPRFLEFEEDWRRWETDIGMAWRDHIRPNEVIQIHVVFPDSFRGYLTRPVHADVIISQGHWLHRFSTLSTIHHYHHLHPPHSYAVACSLPRHIGGIALADAARVMYCCNQDNINCRTSYEWHDIPFTVAPTHEVNHGHAFNINIIDAPTLSNVASSSTTRTRKRQFADIEDASLMQQPHEDDFEVTDEEGNALIVPAREDYESSSLHSGDIGLLIFRLSEPDAHSFAPSTTYMAILEEAIRACRARRRDIRCFHYVPVTPTGVHTEAEEVIILQSVNDIAAGSDEKLVLLDLEIHFHPLRGGLLVPAAASRKVIRVNPTLHRDQLLLLTGFLEYCRLQNDRCIIFKNNILWAANDDRTHAMTHGMYLRIQVLHRKIQMWTQRSQLQLRETLRLKKNLRERMLQRNVDRGATHSPSANLARRQVQKEQNGNPRLNGMIMHHHMDE